MQPLLFSNSIKSTQNKKNAKYSLRNPSGISVIFVSPFYLWKGIRNKGLETN